MINKHKGVFTDNLHWPPRLATETLFYCLGASGPWLKLKPVLQSLVRGFKKGCHRRFYTWDFGLYS